jgi:hypothetical protein
VHVLRLCEGYVAGALRASSILLSALCGASLIGVTPPATPLRCLPTSRELLPATAEQLTGATAATAWARRSARGERKLSQAARE